METPWFIAPSDFLSHLDPQERDKLFANAQRRRYHRNDVVFHAGSPGENVFILIDGRVRKDFCHVAGRKVHHPLVLFPR